MKWQSESIGDAFKRLSEWHRVFAWLPVWCRQARRTVWLEPVRRRAINLCAGEWDYEYAPLP